MVVLVTGTAGFLGESIAQALRLQGHEVVCVAGTAGKGHGGGPHQSAAECWHALRRRGDGEDVAVTLHLRGREARNPAGFVPALYQNGLVSIWLGCRLGSVSGAGEPRDAAGRGHAEDPVDVYAGRCIDILV